MTTDPATGADTLQSVLQRAAARGFEGQLVARADGLVRCHECHNDVNPAALDGEFVDRLEGASDAADLLMVVWTTCPVCGVKGTLTLGYGPNASDADVQVSPHLAIERARPSVPAD